MEKMNSNYILKIEENEFSVINNLQISDYNPIQDENQNKLLISKINLKLENDDTYKKLFIETGYLKVKQVK